MTDKKKSTRIEVHDILAAFSLLTRISVPVNHIRAGTRANNATWAYPIVGAVIGSISGVIATIINLLGLPDSFCAVVALFALIIITGAMHEDGLADCADGFWGGQNKTRRLEIMKDSSIGVYGASALIIFLLAEWSAIEVLISDDIIWALTGVGAVSRLPMVIAMRFVSNAKNTGLSANVGRPQLISIYVAIIMSLIISLICFGILGITIFLIGLISSIPVFLIAIKKIGGQTGDVLGASQKFAEIGALLAIIIL